MIRKGSFQHSTLLCLHRKVQLQGAVTSITPRGQGHQFFVGTNEAQIYRFSFSDFKDELIATCHSEAINAIIFPL